MCVKRMVFLSCAVWLAGAGLVSAGHPQERQGFWVGTGGGYGSVDATCDDCEGGDRESRAAWFFKLGWTLNERVLLGGEFNQWTKEEGGITLIFVNASATVTFYPQASSGFFLKGGVGKSYIHTEFGLDGTTIPVALGSGLGLLAGAGYDVRVGRKVSITPSINFWYGRLGDLKILALSETLARNWTHNVVGLTVGMTFH